MDIEKYLKKRVYEYERVVEFTDTEAYNLLAEVMQKTLDNIVKEGMEPEGNKDYLTGKACGVKVFFDTVDKIIRYGEEAQNTLNK